MSNVIIATIAPNWRPGDAAPYRPGHTCTALGVSASGKAPIQDLCRALVSAGVSDAPMTVMRDGRASFLIGSIHAAAGWTVREGDERPRFVRHSEGPYQTSRSSRSVEPHMRNSGLPATNPPETEDAHVRQNGAPVWEHVT